jgi:hypothetical protein
VYWSGVVFICVKNYIVCRELWTDEDFEIIEVVVKGRNTRFTWEIVGIYRAPNENMRVIEKLTIRTGYMGNSTKRSIIGVTSTYPTQNGMETWVEIVELKFGMRKRLQSGST